MKEKLEAKIEEILNHIMTKDVTEITPMEYGILDAALKEINLRQESEERNKAFQDALRGVMMKTYTPPEYYPVA